MAQHFPKSETAHHPLKRSSWVYVLIFFSGISSLIYQIVWARMLTLVFGHTIYSVSVVLSAFMAGLGLGSYLWGTSIDKIGKPLLIYGKVEVLIGVTAAVLSIFLSYFSPVYAWIYQWLPGFSFLAVAVKTVLAFSLMLIPTMLMGATLPITCKYFVTDDTNLGVALGVKGNFDMAINHYKAAIKFKPDFVSAHSNLGNALHATEKPEKAIFHFKKAIKLKPNFAPSYYNLGVVLMAEQKTIEAILYFKMAVKLKPDYAEAHSNLGVALFSERQTEEAISH
jgi:tetratricopeptide (TPR) repeat protein